MAVCWPTHDPKGGKQYGLANSIRIRAGAHAFEAKVFNLVVGAYLDANTRDAVALKDPEIERILDNSPRAASMVIGPTGDQIGDVRQEEGILYADIDLSASVELKQLHDVAGYYNRFDIFKLTVDRSSNRPITFEPMSFNAQASTGLVQKEEARV